MNFFVPSDLVKANGHKYVKRTGTPGHYEYWYKMPDGSIVANPTPDSQEQGKSDHLKRLIFAKREGLHSKNNQEIADEVGVTKEKVRQHASNLLRQTSTYHSSHLKEAHTDVNHESYQGHATESEAHHDGGGTPTASRGTSASRPAAATRTAPTRTASARATPSAPVEDAPTPRPARAARPARQETPAAAETPTRAASAEEKKQAAIQEKRQKLKDIYGIDLGSSASEATPEPVAPAPKPVAAKPDPTPVVPRQSKEDRIRENVQRANEQLTQARTSVERAQQAAVQATSPDTPHAAELRSEISDPTYDRDEAALAGEIAEQNAGGNPYLTKAKGIFERIANNVKPERRAVVGHLMSAIAYLKDEDRPLNNQNIIEEYKRISGKNIRSINGIAEEFEKATFYTLEEVIGNAPLNPEIERMKRGYAAKQFARAKPFLKSAWLTANAGAPPPHPTFGDFKSWTEHGGVKPSWAGTTRLAMPKEIFDAVPKGADGKPKYPPAWMPTHMMPIWNYAYKKMGSDDAYQAGGGGITSDHNSLTGFNVNMGDQATFQEGMIKSAIRKYVQMRGGPKQLTDIPSSKLAEAGLSHADVYKSENDDIGELLKTKIVDSVGLFPFLKEEIEQHKKKSKIKKSFVLVVKSDEIFKSEEAIKKAELINKIKELKKAQRPEYVIGKNNLRTT